MGKFGQFTGAPGIKTSEQIAEEAAKAAAQAVAEAEATITEPTPASSNVATEAVAGPVSPEPVSAASFSLDDGALTGGGDGFDQRVADLRAGMRGSRVERTRRARAYIAKRGALATERSKRETERTELEERLRESGEGFEQFTGNIALCMSALAELRNAVHKFQEELRNDNEELDVDKRLPEADRTLLFKKITGANNYIDRILAELTVGTTQQPPNLDTALVLVNQIRKSA